MINIYYPSSAFAQHRLSERTMRIDELNEDCSSVHSVKVATDSQIYYGTASALDEPMRQKEFETDRYNNFNITGLTKLTQRNSKLQSILYLLNSIEK